MLPEYLVLDGGLGTCPEIKNSSPLWSTSVLINNKDRLKEAYKRFVLCGSDIIQTATYQLNDELISQIVDIDSMQTVVDLACDIAVETRDEIISNGEYGWRGKRKLFITVNIGPIGACLKGCQEYDGSYINDMEVKEIKELHESRLSILVMNLKKGFIDFIALETIPSIKEAKVLMDMLQGVPYYICMTCKDYTHTCNDDDIETIVPLLTDDVIAVGINCSRPIYISSLIRRIKEKAKIMNKFLPKLIVYANNGDNYENEKFIASKEEDKIMAYIDEWMKLGVKMVGGCCGVGYEELEQISRSMSTFQNKSHNNL